MEKVAERERQEKKKELSDIKRREQILREADIEISVTGDESYESSISEDLEDDYESKNDGSFTEEDGLKILMQGMLDIYIYIYICI